MKHTYIALIVFPLLVLLNACSDQLPEFYGVYALNEGKLIQLGDNTTEEQRRDFSKDVSIIVYNQLLESNVNINKSVFLTNRIYIRNQIEQVLMSYEGFERNVNTTPISKFYPSDTISVKFKPVENKSGMFYVVPTKSLSPGLYALTIIPNEVYFFAVGIGNIQELKSKYTECMDLDVTTIYKDAPFSWNTWNKMTVERVGKRKKINGNIIIKESFIPCNKADNPVFEKKLIEAVENNNLDEVKGYLSDGVDVNAQNEYGRTPLDIAVSIGSINLVKVLLEAGANVNITGRGYYSSKPLVIAMDKGFSEIVTLLKQNGAILSNKEVSDIIVANLNNIGTMAQQYYKKSKSLGGGGYSFVGWHIPSTLSKSAFATYKIDKISSIEVEIIGIGFIKGEDGKNPVKSLAYIKPAAITVAKRN
ncbi:MAG: ankyrin repeat domain-containing protein [Bacteroidetes bacterium]|nr:ankyrin repeat domain-containing protein [Bacteroidota bacterium]